MISGRPKNNHIWAAVDVIYYFFRMDNLQAQILRKYFHKNGNKLVFFGGLSMNKLVQAMWDDMGYVSIDVGFFSRVVNSKAKLNKDHLISLFRLLKISDQDKITLLNTVNSTNKLPTTLRSGF